MQIIGARRLRWGVCLVSLGDLRKTLDLTWLDRVRL